MIIGIQIKQPNYVVSSENVLGQKLYYYRYGFIFPESKLFSSIWVICYSNAIQSFKFYWLSSLLEY